MSGATAPSQEGGGGDRPPGKILALDLGSVRIGIAISDSRQILATPQGVMQRSGEREADHRRIADLAREVGAIEVVVGLPLSLSGSDSTSTRAIRIEVGELRDLLEIPVLLVDERLSSVEASARRAEMRNLSNSARRRGRGGTARTHSKKGARPGPAVIDDLAAAIILQALLDRRVRERGGSE